MKGFGMARTSFIITMSMGLVMTSGAAVAQSMLPSFGDDVALLFCSQVRHNNASEFRNKLREYRLRIRDIYPHIRCNGETMIQFAQRNGSFEIGRFIAYSVLIDDLHKLGDATWAQNLPQQNRIRQVIDERLEHLSQ
ncbi:DUF3718 domain-containing protein [Pseudidiomarina andamanensis]|uniref:DUF3718 domain-containing protein n=2 Tax=Pseudidiomarina andamanensis TaxID=1940690 RepID=A0AA92IN84_9GAMM|nr:DUF3718 domain-containing protein [Pseudidiomarina andamanensis]